MGTIVIEQYTKAGSVGQGNITVPCLDSELIRTATTTTTSNSTLILDKDTTFVTIDAVENHRVSTNADTSTNYATIKAGERRDFAVTGGQTLTYRADA